jgi:hypothetical protein
MASVATLSAHLFFLQGQQKQSLLNKGKGWDISQIEGGAIWK